jgi:hypothetical protein
MSERVIHGKGSLSKLDDEQFVTDVTYQIWERQATKYGLGEWKGILLQVSKLDALKKLFFAGTGSFILKTEDGRKGEILITHMEISSNTTAIPINFQGSGPLE